MSETILGKREAISVAEKIERLGQEQVAGADLVCISQEAASSGARRQRRFGKPDTRCDASRPALGSVLVQA